MKRSDVKLNQAIDELEAAEARRGEIHEHWLDEYAPVACTDTVVNMSVHFLYMAPFFMPAPMRLAAIFAGVTVDAGSATFRMGLYRGVRPNKNNRDLTIINAVGGTFPGLVNGSYEWNKIDLSPTHTIPSGLINRFMWKLNREQILRPGEVYGLAFMTDDVDGHFLGGDGRIIRHSAFADLTARSNLGDFPDTVAMFQGSAWPMPGFVLRSAHGMAWIGG